MLGPQEEARLDEASAPDSGQADNHGVIPTVFPTGWIGDTTETPDSGQAGEEWRALRQCWAVLEALYGARHLPGTKKVRPLHAEAISMITGDLADDADAALAAVEKARQR